MRIDVFRERDDFLKFRIEGEQRCLVMLAVEHTHRKGNGLSCTVHVAAYRHAPADVEHDRQADRRVARVEIADFPLRPGVEYLKIVAAQVAGRLRPRQSLTAAVTVTTSTPDLKVIDGRS